jgi:hypothetical protein
MIDRVKNILLSPKTEWPVISGETATVQSLYVGYILILAAIGPIAIAIRFGAFGIGIGAAVTSYVIGLVMVYVLALVADALAPSFGGEKNFIRALQLVTFSFTAAWVAGIFHLVPSVGSLLSLLAAIYSLYTLYLGAPVLRKCAPEKAAGYTIVLVLCAIVIGGVLTYLTFSMMGGFPMGMGMQ